MYFSWHFLTSYKKQYHDKRDPSYFLNSKYSCQLVISFPLDSSKLFSGKWCKLAAGPRCRVTATVAADWGKSQQAACDKIQTQTLQILRWKNCLYSSSRNYQCDQYFSWTNESVMSHNSLFFFISNFNTALLVIWGAVSFKYAKKYQLSSREHYGEH